MLKMCVCMHVCVCCPKGDMLACEGTSGGSITVAASLEGVCVTISSVHSTEGGSMHLNASGCDTPGSVALELGVSFSKQAPSGTLWKLSRAGN